MREEQELQIFQLISAAGTAKSMYIEAIQVAKKGEFDKADELIKEGKDYYLKGHNIHVEMLSDLSSFTNLILVHAEDQMMSAETIQIMATEIIELYKEKFVKFS